MGKRVKVKRRSECGMENSGEETVHVTLEICHTGGPCWDTQENGVWLVLGRAKERGSTWRIRGPKARTLENAHILEEGKESKNV